MWEEFVWPVQGPGHISLQIREHVKKAGRSATGQAFKGCVTLCLQDAPYIITYCLLPHGFPVRPSCPGCFSVEPYRIVKESFREIGLPFKSDEEPGFHEVLFFLVGSHLFEHF